MKVLVTDADVDIDLRTTSLLPPPRPPHEKPVCGNAEAAETGIDIGGVGTAPPAQLEVEGNPTETLVGMGIDTLGVGPAALEEALDDEAAPLAWYTLSELIDQNAFVNAEGLFWT